MRIMAIDYGDARTGVAISDPTGLLAGYTTVIQSRKEGWWRRSWPALRKSTVWTSW